MEILSQNTEIIRRIQKSRADWNYFARTFLSVRLDREQRNILEAIQHERRVSVRSGTARGKDFVSAVASICFLYLTPRMVDDTLESAKVILTAPTGRQIRNIMMPEVSKNFSKLRRFHDVYFPGVLLADGIRMEDQKDWFLDGFKASDNNVEAWSGLHAPHVMVVVTEASGLPQVVFDSVEGILQGDSRLVLVFNPNNTTGEAYYSTRSPLYKKFKLNCMESPNVKNKLRLLKGEISEQEFKKRRIPGQVDFEWVDEKFKKPGWFTEINKADFNHALFDVEWFGKYYRPGKLARVKILGEFAEESDDILVPLSWIEAANNRWHDLNTSEDHILYDKDMRAGYDVAGQGRDNTVEAKRYNMFVKSIETLALTKNETIHMDIADRIGNTIKKGGMAFIDTIGEGAGVYSRLRQTGYFNAFSCKFSHSAAGLKDFTGEYRFTNMRAYLLWCIRDALNPAFGMNLALPPCDELTEELTETKFKYQLNGEIYIEPKEEVKKRIGRSTDYMDALGNTFYPVNRKHIPKSTANLEDLGIF